MRILGGLLLASLMMGACGFGAESLDAVAIRLIEGELETIVGLGELTGSCDEPTDTEPGDSFACTGLAEDGQTVVFEAVVQDEDSENDIQVMTSNVFLVSDLASLTVNLLNDANPGLGLTEDGVDCGDVPLLWDLEGTSAERDCTVSLPAGEDIPVVFFYDVPTDFVEIIPQ